MASFSKAGDPDAIRMAAGRGFASRPADTDPIRLAGATPSTPRVGIEEAVDRYRHRRPAICCSTNSAKMAFRCVVG